MQVVKKASYRQRVCEDSKGAITLIFGNDPVPANIDGSPQKVLVDHDIVDTAIITDHVDLN